jgi:hypothetical protein
VGTRNKDGKAKADIVDLDVKEVSVVDKPAIKRKFLVVKNETGDLEVNRQEATTMADDIGILDLLGVGQELATGKGADQQESSHVLDRLMSLSVALKKETGDVVSDTSCGEFCSIAEVIGDPVDKGVIADLTSEELNARVEKATENMLAATEQLTSTDGSGPIQVFVGRGEDPEVMIQKAGAKMKRARLSAFEKAVQTLVTLLSEIKGEQKTKDKTQKSNEEDESMSQEDVKNRDEKAEGETDSKPENQPSAGADPAPENQPTNEGGIETLTKQMGELAAAMKELGEKFGTEVSALKKRVDELDSTVPPPEGDTDPEQNTDPVKKSIWSGLFS